MARFHHPPTQAWARPAAPGGAGAALRMRASWRALEHPMLEQDGLQLLLQHVRNVLAGTALIAAGLAGLQRFAVSLQPSAGNMHLACLVAAGIGSMLLVLNLCSGWRELARRREPLSVRTAAVLAYVAVSALLTHAMVELRAAF